jgi:hypothetical protein
MDRRIFIARVGARISATGLVLLALGAGTAAADGCLEQVRQLAARHGVSIDPPTLSPDSPSPTEPTEPPGITTRELGRSGGVIEPPETRDKAVISPPRDLHYGMPTVPDVKQAPDKPSRGESANSGATPDGRLDLTALQALLVAAKDQAERGSEADCLERLAKARELSGRAP